MLTQKELLNEAHLDKVIGLYIPIIILKCILQMGITASQKVAHG